jgi:hypothetical protein
MGESVRLAMRKGNPAEPQLSAKERERLKVLHEVEQGHLKQVEAARPCTARI